MAEELLKQVHMAVIRGNVSEIQSLAGKDAQTKVWMPERRAALTRLQQRPKHWH